MVKDLRNQWLFDCRRYIQPGDVVTFMSSWHCNEVQGTTGVLFAPCKAIVSAVYERYVMVKLKHLTECVNRWDIQAVNGLKIHAGYFNGLKERRCEKPIMKHSILVNLESTECAICGARTSLQYHHCMHGTANRQKADKYGLTVWLCASCHERLHSAKDENWRELDLELKQDAQRKFEDLYGHEQWMREFGKNYLP